MCVCARLSYSVLTGQYLEDGGKEEAAIFDQVEELEYEGNEGEETEQHREDHEGLHSLEPVCQRWREGGREGGREERRISTTPNIQIRPTAVVTVMGITGSGDSNSEAFHKPSLLVGMQWYPPLVVRQAYHRSVLLAPTVQA